MFKRNSRSRQAVHRSRLKEKFLSFGLSGFLDREIVELLFVLGTSNRDCGDQAEEALKRFKSLRGVLDADERELKKIKGINHRSLFGIRLMQQVSRRFLRERMMERPLCQSSKEVFDFLYHSMRGEKKEKFKVLYLDAKNQILEEKTAFEGTVDSSAVYPREVIKSALLHDASAMIFVHNHPSGDPSPSQNDREITQEIIFAAKLIQIKVLDHIIIGNNRYYSFADSGLIEEYEFLFQKVRSSL